MINNYEAFSQIAMTLANHFDSLYYVDIVLSGNAEVIPIHYRAKKADGTYVVCSTRGFVLSDKNGNPEYFGGIIIPE